MEIRPIHFADLPALVELEREATVAALPEVYPTAGRFPLSLHLRARSQEFSDPWITFTLAEDDLGVCGWIEYTENQLRNLVISERMNDSGLRDELYGEGLRHWRAGEVSRVWLWVLADDQESRADYEARGWRPTGRTRRSPLVPHPVIAEYLLAMG
jgi:hypothetical protein